MKPRCTMFPGGFADLVHDNLARLLKRTGAARVVLAYSGGMDSTVLLHLLHLLHRFDAPFQIALLAAHVNHKLHRDADRWEQDCRSEAARLGVGIEVLPVQLPVRSGCGPEAAARAARYHALRGLMDAATLLLTAHHRDDQAETVLLQLMRGAGPAGLAAMPELARFGAGWLARPMLEAPRTSIRAWAVGHDLQWVEDPANEALHYDRNYLRRRVAPLLEARWPQWHTAAARAAHHQADAHELVGAQARRLLASCLSADGRALSRRACLALPGARLRAVLRCWIGDCGLPVPGARQLERLVATLVSAHPRNGAAFEWSGATVRFYRGWLYAMTLPLPLSPVRDLAWCAGGDLEVPALGLVLCRRELLRQAPGLADAGDLMLRFRRGGERCACRGGFHRSLKNIFQEHGVPPWERGRIPLVYAGGGLRLVWNLARCE